MSFFKKVWGVVKPYPDDFNIRNLQMSVGGWRFLSGVLWTAAFICIPFISLLCVAMVLISFKPVPLGLTAFCFTITVIYSASVAWRICKIADKAIDKHIDLLRDVKRKVK